MKFKSIKRQGWELLKSPSRKEFQYCSLAQEMRKRPKISKTNANQRFLVGRAQ